MNQSVVYSRWLQPACLVGLTAPVRQALRDGTAKASTLTDLVKRMDAAGCAGPSAAAAARPVANAAPTRQVLNASKALLKTLYSRPAANKNPANTKPANKNKKKAKNQGAGGGQKSQKKAKNAKKFTVARFVNTAQAGPKPFNARRKFVVTNADLEGPVLEGLVKNGTSAGKTTPAQPSLARQQNDADPLAKKLPAFRVKFEKAINMPWPTIDELKPLIQAEGNAQRTKEGKPNIAMKIVSHHNYNNLTSISEKGAYEAMALDAIHKTDKFRAMMAVYNQMNAMKVVKHAPDKYRKMIDAIHADINNHAPRILRDALRNYVFSDITKNYKGVVRNMMDSKYKQDTINLKTLADKDKFFKTRYLPIALKDTTRDLQRALNSRSWMYSNGAREDLHSLFSALLDTQQKMGIPMEGSPFYEFFGKKLAQEVEEGWTTPKERNKELQKILKMNMTSE